MTIATGVALGLAWMLAPAGENTGGAKQAAVLVLLVSSVFTFAPALLHVSAERWGLVVAGSSMARMLALLSAGGLASRVVEDLPRQPFAIALLAGAGVVLVAETAMAIVILRGRSGGVALVPTDPLARGLRPASERGGAGPHAA
ncbi:MAG: hypothetical protein SFY69_06370 [Planctomycetota bacterium]|nr:hypothetical protein [Planctomycetota bacterium]